MAKVVDIFLIYQFLRRLVQPFNKWKAYELGVIDENGKVILPKEKRNSEQNKAWGYFDILVANLKKLLAKIPGGRTRLASFAAALLLLREHQEGNVLTEDINDIEKKLIAEIKKLSKDEIRISGADKDRYPVDYDLFFENHKKVGKFKGYGVYFKSGENYDGYIDEYVLYNKEDIVAIFHLLKDKKYYKGYHVVWANIHPKYRKRGFAKDFYVWLIQKRNYILMSGSEQTDGGQKIWIDLYKTRGIYVYAVLIDKIGKMNFFPVEYNKGKLTASHYPLYNDEYEKEVEELKKSLESVEDELLKNPENKVLLDLKKYYEKQIDELETSLEISSKNVFLVATSRENISEANTTASSGVIKASENSEKMLLLKKILKRRLTKKKKHDK